MAYSLSERIAREASATSEQNRASFLLLRNDIKDALNDGWSVRLIWKTLHKEEKIRFTYETFLSYVKKLIRNEDSEPSNKNQISKSEQNASKEKLAPEKQAVPESKQEEQPEVHKVLTAEEEYANMDVSELLKQSDDDDD